jgi:c-di-GMP-binding flagellar brake protein YcgR
MERRRHQREPLCVPVEVETADGASYPAQACDFSSGGMALRCEYLLAPTLICEVHVSDIGGLVFSREAVVLRVDDLPNGDFLVGLAFDEPLPPPTRADEAALRAAG